MTRTEKPKRGQGFAPATINHRLAVLSSFYEFIGRAGVGPAVNPVPTSARGDRSHSHRSPLEERTPNRRGGYRQKMPALIPRAIPDDLYAEVFGALRAMVLRVNARLGLDLVLHDFRYTCGIRLASDSSIPITDVQAHLRHRDTIRAWQERLWTPSNGKPRKDVHSILAIVRAFYLDIAQWAAEDPGVWAQWVTPCPISDGDLRPFQKIKLHHRARMHARTRTLMPFLPKLIANAHTRLVEATELLIAAEAATPGTGFQAIRLTYQRKPIPERSDRQGVFAPVKAICLTPPTRR